MLLNYQVSSAGRILLRKISFLCEMVNSYENGTMENGNTAMWQTPRPIIKTSLPWLDVRVFYARVSKCEIDESTPEYLTVNHIPLDPETLLEVNGVRTCIDSDGASTLLRRDRLDRKSEEATFVSTDSIRITGSVKFDVFDKDVILLSGTLELCNTDGNISESANHSQAWNMSCESDLSPGISFLKAKRVMSPDSASPTIEIYVAGTFSGTPIILTKTLQLNFRKKQWKGMLDSIPEYEASESQANGPSRHHLQLSEHSDEKLENEGYGHLYSGTEYLEGEEGELSWFSAGVRVGVGIGLSVCIGVGIGVGLLVKTYQGTTRNFRRRLL